MTSANSGKELITPSLLLKARLAMEDGEDVPGSRLLLQPMAGEARGLCQRLRGRESLKQPKPAGPRPRRREEAGCKFYKEVAPVELIRPVEKAGFKLVRFCHLETGRRLILIPLRVIETIAPFSRSYFTSLDHAGQQENNICRPQSFDAHANY